MHVILGNNIFYLIDGDYTSVWRVFCFRYSLAGAVGTCILLYKACMHSYETNYKGSLGVITVLEEKVD